MKINTNCILYIDYRYIITKTNLNFESLTIFMGVNNLQKIIYKFISLNKVEIINGRKP